MNEYIEDEWDILIGQQGGNNKLCIFLKYIDESDPFDPWDFSSRAYCKNVRMDCCYEHCPFKIGELRKVTKKMGY